MNRFVLYGSLIGMLSFFMVHSMQACSVCFGNKDDIMTQSLSVGVLFLLGVLLSVLFGLFIFVLYLIKKEREVNKVC